MEADTSAPKTDSPKIINDQKVDLSRQNALMPRLRINPNKKFVLGVLIGLILFAFGAWYFLFSKSPSLYQAEMSLVSGQVEKSEKSGTWIELKSGDSVKQGDLVRVNGIGKAVIALDDGSAIRLDDNSRVKLSSLDPKNIKIINEAGEIYTRVVKADRPFVVMIDKESYKAMGTAYKTINTASEKGVLVYESKVKVVTADVEVSEGKKYFTTLADDGLEKQLLDITSDELATDLFLQWNKSEDQKSSEFKKYMGVMAEKTENKIAESTQSSEKTETEVDNVVETPAPAVVGSINLTGSAGENSINLRWTTSNVDTSNGFKIIKGTSANPVYPGNSAIYAKSGNDFSWVISDGAVYHFRICQYTGSGCGVYSNDIEVRAPIISTPEGTVNSITISSTGGRNVSWIVDGYSDKGYKLVWSKNSGPTYPTRENDRYNYFSSPETNTGSIDAFKGAGTYYVRVCEYLGGSCGVYSNEITVEIVEL